MVQTAQIQVTVGTKKGGLTREQWLEEQNKKETRADKINAKYDAELAALEQPTPVAPVELVIEPQTPEFEGTITSSEPVEPVSKTPVYNVGGTSNGVYIKVEVNTLANKAKRYKIVIENNPDLNDYYKNKVFETLKDVKDEYAKKDVYVVNGREVVKQPWLTPKEVNTGVTYQLQDAEGNSLKSPIQTDLDNTINKLLSVSDLRGKGVTIEEVEDVNDSVDVQSNFRKKSKLVVKFEGKAIAEIPSNSEIRFKLQFTKDEAGKTRLLPTTASINYIIQKDFDRTAPMPLTDWYDLFETANGKATYKIGYVKFENGNYVLKTSNGEELETFSEDKQPVLGATYLVVTDAKKKETKFSLQTPKLRDVVLNDGRRVTKDEIIALINQVPKIAFNETGKELYIKVVNGLVQEINNSDDPRVKEIGNLIAKDLGAQFTPGRAISTEEQLKKLDKLEAYSPETANDNNNIIADFFLNRIITLTPQSEEKHLITTNPNTIFLDNTVQVNNLVSGGYNEAQEAPRFQVATPQETPQDVVREMVDTLKGTGLANKVFEMTAEEIDAKLQEIGFSEEVKQQVLSSMLEKDINVDGVITKVKPIDVDVVNGFYSPLEKIFSESKQDKMPVKQWMDKFAKGEEAKWTGLADWLSQQTGSISKQDILNYLKDNRIEIVEVVKGQGELNVVPMEDEPNILEVFAADDPNGDYRGNIGEILIEDNGKFTANIPEAPRKTFNTQKEAEDYIKRNTSYAEQTKFSQYQLEGEKENYKEVLVVLPSKIKFSDAKKEYDNYYNSLISKYGESGRLRYKII